ncbi:caspase domain-containing protein [Roridomyces roridus]|uniref:Caspase domain-containing protein n=1 Tax=Roridomyces roridus TaxID=1738132 RepID=A0AAD7C8I5_9AGAR|nr:caspase domain-containing protein [Roridomyces roridus]
MPITLPRHVPHRQLQLVNAYSEGQSLKAVLVGVNGKETASRDFPELKAAHRDAEKMQKLLIERGNYHPCDITLLIDDGVPGHMQPTRVNILKAIKDLVKDARPGDHFCFHYSGHSTQFKTCSSDGSMDEQCLVPCDSNGTDSNVITDTELSTALIMPLPFGSQLVVFLDTCHSASFLSSLKHSKCNGDDSASVSFDRTGNPRAPGKSLSPRFRSFSYPITAARSNARLMSILPNRRKITPPPNPATRLLARRSELSMKLTWDPPASSVTSDCDSKRMDHRASPRSTFSYRAPAAAPMPKDSQLLAVGESDEVASTLPGEFRVFPEIPRCASPDRMFSSRGFCADSSLAGATGMEEELPGGVKADVISLSSCREDQIAYEDEEGHTMTSALVDGLMSNPDQSLKEVLLFISRAMQEQAMARHARVEEYKKRCQDRQPRMQAKNLKLHERTMSFVTPDSLLTSTRTPSSFNLVRRLPTFPARANKSLKKQMALLKKLNLKQILMDITDGKANPARYDVERQDAQSPEFSSAGPLDLGRPMRL